MQYTVYHLYKKAHNIRSPSQLFPTHVACCHFCNWPKAMAFVDSFNVNFLKLFFNCLIFYNLYIVYTFFMCNIHVS